MTDILAALCKLTGCTHDGPHIFPPRPPLTDDQWRRIDRDPQPDFRCSECERQVNTDWEVVTCACNDDPTCDPCCETYHERTSA